MTDLRTRHALLDMYRCRAADGSDTAFTEAALRAAVKAAGATLLKSASHDFGEGQGVTVFALLAESHIALHSWPEKNYIAADIFTCGGCEAEKAAQILIERFRPLRHHLEIRERGLEVETASKGEKKNYA